MCAANWLEVSLTVDGELAESVAEVLARYIPDGVVIESTSIIHDLQGAESFPAGPLRVFGYLPMDDNVQEIRQRLEKSLWFMGRIRNLPEPVYKVINEDDWSQAWKREYRPLVVGRRLAIIPAWLDYAVEGRLNIRITPGMAFGTGAHPTTQMCLELIENILGSHNMESAASPGMDVIDVGCGSGILSIAALKLGAHNALGVDVDKDAIRSAHENARINHVGAHLQLGRGSVSEILSGSFSIRQAPLVCVNILAPVIVDLLDEGLGSLLANPGTLILSGILEEQGAEVEAALEKHELGLIEQRQLGDWLAIQAVK